MNGKYNGTAKFIDHVATNDFAEATVFYDTSSATNSLDIFIKTRPAYTFMTNFRIRLNKVSADEVTVQAKVFCQPYFANTIASNSWVEGWDLFGYGQMNSEGGGRAYAIGQYTNEYITNISGSLPDFNGTTYEQKWNILVTATNYDYEEYFDAAGMTTWKLGWAPLTVSEFYSVSNIQTNTLTSPVQWVSCPYEVLVSSNYTAIVTNNSDTYPLTEVVLSTNALGLPIKVVYNNTNAKPANIPAILQGLDPLPYTDYTNAVLQPIL